MNTAFLTGTLFLRSSLSPEKRHYSYSVGWNSIKDRFCGLVIGYKLSGARQSAPTIVWLHSFRMDRKRRYRVRLL